MWHLRLPKIKQTRHQKNELEDLSSDLIYPNTNLFDLYGCLEFEHEEGGLTII